MSQQKVIDQTLKDLESKDDSVILNGLIIARDKGNASLIPSIVALLQHDNEEIREKSKTLLFDLKDKTSVDALLNEFDKIKSVETRNLILQSLWQSNMQPVDSTARLVKIAIDGSLEECIEVYSIITNCIDEKFPDAELMEALLYINTNVETIKNNHQKQLVRDIEKFLLEQQDL